MERGATWGAVLGKVGTSPQKNLAWAISFAGTVLPERHRTATATAEPLFPLLRQAIAFAGLNFPVCVRDMAGWEFPGFSELLSPEDRRTFDQAWTGTRELQMIVNVAVRGLVDTGCTRLPAAATAPEIVNRNWRPHPRRIVSGQTRRPRPPIYLWPDRGPDSLFSLFLHRFSTVLYACADMLARCLECEGVFLRRRRDKNYCSNNCAARAGMRAIRARGKPRGRARGTRKGKSTEGRVP
jgi:hypothetical protein